MTASSPEARRGLRVPRRLWPWIVAPPLLLALAVAVACWWLTEPFDPPSTVPTPPWGLTKGGNWAPQPKADRLEWPAARLEGESAKPLLLDWLLAARSRLERVEGYTATFRKQERIGGKLGPEQVMEMKVRHRPFSVYLRFLEPNPGKEVVYAEGRHDNKMIAHSTGLSRRLLPRVAVAPDHPLAMADNRHPITEAGLANLVDRLIGFRRMDLTDPDAVTVLDRVEGPNGRTLLRSTHLHSHVKPDRPFARIEILYDPETRIPVQISNYDWPPPGHEGEPELAERYIYRDLNLDAELSDLDFDPANPSYAFHRF